MHEDRARELAEALYRRRRDAEGEPLIDHVRRVAAAVGPEARVVAWLHEALERTSISEQELLEQGISTGELRALRLLTLGRDLRSTASYLGHVELIALARGEGASHAQAVKEADLEDRLRNHRARADEWSPLYARALEILRSPRSE